MMPLDRNWKRRGEATIPLLVTKRCSRPGLSQLPYWGCPQAIRNGTPTERPPFLWKKGSHLIQKAVFSSSQAEVQPGDHGSEDMGLGARRHPWF